MDVQTSIDNSTPKVDMEMLNKIVKAAIRLKGNPEPNRKGGYIAICDYSDIPIIVSVPVGEMPEHKKYGYMRNACEKLTRIRKHNLTSSFQMRNEEKEHWGGGVAFPHLTVSFSGFVELIDEAVSVVYGSYYSYKIFGLLKGDILEEKVLTETSRYQSIYSPENPFCVPLAQAVFGKK